MLPVATAIVPMEYSIADVHNRATAPAGERAIWPLK